MVEQLKNLFSPERSDLQGEAAANAVSQWADAQGVTYSGSADGRRFILSGVVGKRNLRLELGVPTRDFIHVAELLARETEDE